MSGWTFIAHTEVGSGGAATIEFLSIASTYTDLLLVVSARSTVNEASGGSYANLKPNNSVSSQTGKTLRGTGSTVASNSETTAFFTIVNSGFTASTFGNSLIYIPNHSGSQTKSISIDGVNENNVNNQARQELMAGVFTTATAISSLYLTPGGGSFAQYSSATLYGITKGSSGGVTVS